MRYFWLASILLIGGLEAAPAEPAEKVQVRGKVMDSRGRPVAGAEVAYAWGFSGSRAMAVEGETTDSSGAFALKVAFHGDQAALLVMDLNRRTGAAVALKRHSVEEPIQITLEPLVTVQAAFTSKELGSPPERIYVSLQLQPGGIGLGSCTSTGANFSMRIPRGEWRLQFYEPDVQTRNEQRRIDGAQPLIDLGTIDFQPTVIARHYGKPPPSFSLTEARGARQNVQIGDFHGKWLLIEFWAYW